MAGRKLGNVHVNAFGTKQQMVKQYFKLFIRNTASKTSQHEQLTMKSGKNIQN